MLFRSLVPMEIVRKLAPNARNSEFERLASSARYFHDTSVTEAESRTALEGLRTKYEKLTRELRQKEEALAEATHQREEAQARFGEWEGALRLGTELKRVFEENSDGSSSFEEFGQELLSLAVNLLKGQSSQPFKSIKFDEDGNAGEDQEAEKEGERASQPSVHPAADAVASEKSLGDMQNGLHQPTGSFNFAPELRADQADDDGVRLHDELFAIKNLTIKYQFQTTVRGKDNASQMEAGETHLTE